MKQGHVDRIGEELRVRLHRRGPLATRLRTVEGGRYDSADGSTWFPLQAAPVLLEALGAVEVAWSPEAIELVGTSRPTSTRSSTDDFTPATLNQAVAAMVSRAFPTPVWVTGQLDSWAKGHDLFFDLIERAEGLSVTRAKVRAYIPRGQRGDLERTVERAGLALRDGLQVRLQGMVGVWVQGGSYQFTVTAVDPTYTLARLEENRTRVLASLRSEGIADRNLALPIPQVPLRVGIVSARGSDALQDLLATLRSSDLGFRVVFHHARVQGQDLTSSMVDALRWFYLHCDQIDVLCIVRGGGARSDLAGFDALAIARGVCHQRVPVLIGIGHETDTCVLDDIAHSHRTPTAVGTAIVERVQAFLERIKATANRLTSVTRRRTHRARLENQIAEQRLRRATARNARGAQVRLRALSHALGHTVAMQVEHRRQRIDGYAQRLAVATSAQLRTERRALGVSPGRLGRAAFAALRQTQIRLEVFEARRRASDPAKVLERGYAIVRSHAGLLVSPAQAPSGTSLRIQLHGGTLRATSEGEADE